MYQRYCRSKKGLARELDIAINFLGLTEAAEKYLDDSVRISGANVTTEYIMIFKLLSTLLK